MTSKLMRDVKFKLTDAEIIMRAKDAAELRAQRAKIEEEFDRVKASFKSKIKDAESRIALALYAVGSGEELRHVEVTQTFDYDGAMVIQTYEGTEVERRKMTPEESQIPLALVNGI